MEGTERAVASEAQNLISDLPSVWQQGPADPDRAKAGEANVLAAEEADLGGNADAVSVDEEGLGGLHPRSRV
jgi:hypothetical protein